MNSTTTITKIKLTQTIKQYKNPDYEKVISKHYNVKQRTKR